MNTNNLIFTLDACKWDHESLYPDGFENSYSYMTCRSDETHKESIFFGLQYILQKWLTPLVAQNMLNEAKEMALHAFGEESCINHHSWQRIIDEMGGGFLQRDFHRDILATAFKSSCQKFNGEWVDVKKKTTEAFKRSLSGKFSTVKREGEFVTIPQLSEEDPEKDYLENVFINGELVRFQKFEEIKNIIWKNQ